VCHGAQPGAPVGFPLRGFSQGAQKKPSWSFLALSRSGPESLEGCSRSCIRHHRARARFHEHGEHGESGAHTHFPGLQAMVTQPAPRVSL
jgi:hypothetical protein